jgi:predicted lactoylglutathione lyase
MQTQLFINLPVKDIQKSMDFFTSLGFTFNAQFTNDQAACMVIGENIFAMLVTEAFFQTFTKKKIADAREVTECLNAISVESKEMVDEIMAKALASGGMTYRDVQDLGWMYSNGFEDLDGHQWEFFWMDATRANS